MNAIAKSSDHVIRRVINLCITAFFFLCASIVLPLSAHAQSNQVTQGDLLMPDELVREILQQNQGVAAMQAAVNAAEAQAEAAGALPDPMLSYQLAPATLDAPNMRVGQSVQLSQSFPWPGTLDLRTDAAKAEASSVEQQLADLRLQLASQARAAYAEWRYVYQALAINTDNQAIIQRLHKTAESAYASGRASQQDVLQAEIELVRLQTQALALKGRQRTVQAQINGMLNRPATALLPPPANVSLSPDLPAFDTLRQAALAHYPKLKGLDAEITASSASAKLAKRDAYPRFTGMVGYNAMWSEQKMRPMIGVGISIPFGGNHKGEIRAAEAKLRQSEAQLVDARSQLLSSLAQDYAKVEQARDNLRLYTDRLLPLAQQSLKAAEIGYRNGRGDFSDLISAERQLLTTKLEQASAQADLYTQLASLNYHTGGALLPSVSATASQDSMKTNIIDHNGRQP
jgi:outer membrane protein TolC